MLFFSMHRCKMDYSQLAEIANFFFEDSLQSVKIPKHKITSDEPKLIENSQSRIRTETNSQDRIRKRKNFGTRETAEIWGSIYGDEPMTSKVTCKICQQSKFEFGERNKWHIGHMVAFSEDGSDNHDNLRPICSKCNLSMGSKNIYDYCREKYPQRTEEIIESLKLK